MQKHKLKKRRRPESLYLLVSLLSYGALLYLFFHYISIAHSIPFLQIMEVILFFSTILFLDLYLLAFTYLSFKSFSISDENLTKVKYYIIIAWSISLLYHFVLWLNSNDSPRFEYYQIGIAITLGAFVFTIGQFGFYFSSVKYYKNVYHKTKLTENRRQVYEVLKDVLSMHQLIRDAMDQDPEIYQMMRWNDFNVLLGQMIDEAGPYVQSSFFTKEDLEQLMGVKLWMENMLTIIEQHPKHKNILKQTKG